MKSSIIKIFLIVKIGKIYLKKIQNFFYLMINYIQEMKSMENFFSIMKMIKSQLN